MRSSPKENQSLEVKVKGISEMEFSLSIFDYTFTNYDSKSVFNSPINSQVMDCFSLLQRSPRSYTF
ncbi:MAG: hypothetical protein EWV81_00980 [Microcystis aeruginosa Ma_SC_T_19800800_S464]|uniref:Uncharacterized protein n=1 Tax=Microcystis aeruginosa Ma_SC_T_19800800_S464 TaxID=2486257 RepID=A0A552E6I3_MICAE|nr:MAG: hypothetical protein EWV81_00980 [Microcystis aeruginosa Ma_SC_T_19800800_S464]